MRRQVSAEIDLTVSEGIARLALIVAVARVPGLRIEESLRVRVGDADADARTLDAGHHGVIHTLDVTSARDGTPVRVAYSATVDGAVAHAGGEDAPIEELTYLRPSRYVESDRLFATAQQEFSGLSGVALVNEVAAWVARRLAYDPGATRPTDGAVETMLARRGVCRDYAHLVAAFLRALDVPARVVGVYAPGLTPMDFHAVTEARVDGIWQVVDSTRLAPRQSLLRISTGRDAADTAFLSSYGAPVQMGEMRVMATTDVDLPTDDHAAPVRLG